MQVFSISDLRFWIAEEIITDGKGMDDRPLTVVYRPLFDLRFMQGQELILFNLFNQRNTIVFENIIKVS